MEETRKLIHHKPRHQQPMVTTSNLSMVMIGGSLIISSVVLVVTVVLVSLTFLNTQTTNESLSRLLAKRDSHGLNVYVTNPITIENFPELNITFPTQMDVNVLNPVTTVSVDNFPPAVNVSFPAQMDVTVLNPVTTVSVDNFPPAVNVSFPTQMDVTVLNAVTTVSVDNFPPAVNVSFPTQMDVTVLNPVTTVSVNNFPPTNVTFPTQMDVTILNPITTVSVDNFPPTNVTFPTQMDVTVLNPVTTVSVDNFPTQLDVTVLNPVANVSIDNFPTVQSVEVINSVLSTSVSNFPATQNVYVTNPLNVTMESTNIAVNNFPSNQQVTVSNLPAVDSQNRLLTSLVSPTNAFGNVLTETLSPVFQTDAVYGLNTQQILYETSGSGVIAAENSAFMIATGTTAASYAFLQSRKRIKYRAGQGCRATFSAQFTTGTTNTNQLAGLGHLEDGIFFGYNTSGTFGILHAERGVREVRLLTVTGGASGAGTATVTLDGTAHSVSIPGSLDVINTQYQLLRGTYTGWRVQPLGTTIYFVSTLPGPRSGSYSITGVSITGSFTTIQSGAVATKTFIAQNNWNGDPLNGLGPSRAVLYPGYLNIYQISIQYMGTGGISLFVQVDGNVTQPTQILNVHTIRGSRTQSLFSNPSFPFSFLAQNVGYGSNVTMRSTAFAGFTEGFRFYTGNRISYVRNEITGAAVAQVMFSLLNPLYYRGRTSQGTVYVMSLNLGVIGSIYNSFIYMYKTVGPRVPYFTAAAPNYQPIGSGSIVLVSSTNYPIYQPENVYDLIFTGVVGPNAVTNFDFSSNLHEEIVLQPGEYLTFVVLSGDATATRYTIAVSMREDY